VENVTTHANIIQFCAAVNKKFMAVGQTEKETSTRAEIQPHSDSQKKDAALIG
jgi:hypothetical protein